MRKKATYKPQMVEKGQMKTYKSPTIALKRKKMKLKETQEQDWEGVGLPVRKGKGRPFNLVQRGHTVKGQYIKGGKGFKLKKKK